MSGEDERYLPLPCLTAQFVHNGRGVRSVLGIGRLVAHQYLTIIGHEGGDTQPPLLPLTEQIGGHIPVAPQVDVPQNFFRLFLGIFLQARHDLLSHRTSNKLILRILGDKTDLAQMLFLLAAQVDPVQQDGAGVVADSRQGVKEGGLAAAALADNGVNESAAEQSIHAVQHGSVAVPDGQILQLQHRRCPGR